MNVDLIKKEFKDIITFPRAVTNKLRAFDTSELVAYLTQHSEYENVKNLIRCICLDISLPLCETCRKPVPYSKRKNRFCCMKCMHASDEVKHKRAVTFDRNYRQHPNKMTELRERMQSTCNDRYGGVGFQSPMLKESAHATVKAKYGVDNVFQNEDIKRKIKETNLTKYGVEYPIQNEAVKQKIAEHWIEVYGVEHPMKCDAGKQKFNKAMQDKYGVDWARQSDEVQQHAIEKSYERYGFSNPAIVKAWDTIQRFSNRVQPLFSRDEFKGLGYVYKWRCMKCGNEFEALLGIGTFIDKDFERLPRCEVCFPRRCGTSAKERELASFCRQFFPNLISNDRHLISPFELDIVIPEIHLALEFNGNYWHSTEGWLDKNRDLSDYFGRHLKKTIACNEKGYRLIHIWEDEWDGHSDVLKAKLTKVFKGDETFDFNEDVVELDKSFYNGIQIPGYVLLEDTNPTLVKRDTFEVENCGTSTFKRKV